ncbi:MAG: HAMP domain-containing sensor histidine kinase [Nitrospirota bacterium]
MRTKLFIAFFVVILIALVSNLIFERLIIRDFEQFAMGTREDELYRVLASVEGAYGEDEGWDHPALGHAVLWGTMLGFEVVVKDTEEKPVMTTEDALEVSSPSMQRRIYSLVNPEEPTGEFEAYPLFVMGKEIGSLHVRPIERVGLLQQKEALFKRRGQNFLLISFVIAGGGALFLSMVFSMFLTVPLKRLKGAAEAVAGGDLDVRVKVSSRDEIGSLTETFNHMVESLKREEDLRRHLTQNIAHELRTPLSVMRSHLEALADGVIENTDEALETLSAELRRLINLVEGIEDVTKAEASFFKKPEYEKVGLGGFVEGIAQGMKPLFQKKGLELSVSARGEAEVVTDPEKLEIALRNILSNALSHTAEGGASVDYGVEGGAFFVAVTDTGPGVPEEEREKIFKRFYKGGGSEGIGLGLSIAKETLELMGGRITVEGAPGGGATFRITLPAKGE